MVYVSVVSGVIILVSKQGRCVAALCWRARSRGRASIFFLLQLTPRGTETMYGGTDGGAGEYTINVYVYHRTTTAKLPLLPMIHIEGRTYGTGRPRRDRKRRRKWMQCCAMG